MTLFAVWTGGLGVGFAVVVVLSAGDLGPVRLVLFVLLAFFLLLAAVRTGVELVKRVRALR